MLFLACFKVGRYLVPKINLFHALKLGPQSKESANFFNKSWVIDGTMIREEWLGTYDGAARCSGMIRVIAFIAVAAYYKFYILCDSVCSFNFLLKGKGYSPNPTMYKSKPVEKRCGN